MSEAICPTTAAVTHAAHEVEREVARLAGLYKATLESGQYCTGLVDAPAARIDHDGRSAPDPAHRLISRYHLGPLQCRLTPREMPRLHAA
jgi:hypothetical protein